MGNVLYISDRKLEAALGRKIERPKRRMTLQTKLAKETLRALEAEARATGFFEIYRAAIDMLRSRAGFAPEAEGKALLATAEMMAGAIGMRLDHVGWTPTLVRDDSGPPPPDSA